VADATASLPVGDEISSDVLSLPMSPSLPEAHQARIASVLQAACR